MIIRFDDELIAKKPELFDNIQTRYLDGILYYVIDSNYRKSVLLVDWLAGQVNKPHPRLIDIANQIPDGSNDDETVVNVVIWINKNMTWVRDDYRWKANEYWATANEIVSTNYLQDDCDGFATMAYNLCVLKGVSQDRLFICAGDVLDPRSNSYVGHAWTAYRPKNYPFNFVFLDGCYHPSDKHVAFDRNLYTINRRSITGFYMRQGAIYKEDERYKSLWFMFNSKKAYPGLQLALK